MPHSGADAGTRVTPRLLRLVFEHQPVSQSNLRDLTGLSISTVSAAIRPLLESGLVEERGVRREAMGRPQVLLGIAAGYAQVVGVQINGDRNLIVQTDLAGTLLRQQPLASGPLSAAELADEIEAFLATARSRPVACLGLALAGLIEPETGVCRLSSVLGWRDVAVGQVLAGRLGLPVVVENDANAFAIATMLFGLLPADVASAVTMTVGRGIGVGLLHERRLFHGRNGAAGEIGHIPVAYAPAFACHCGKPACLESVASVRASRAAIGCGDRALAELAATDPDAVASRVMARAGAHIGRTLAQLAATFDPDTVCLAMEPAHAAPLLLQAIERSYGEHRLSLLRRPTPLTLLTGWDEMWAMGAAGIALHRFIDHADRAG